MQATHHYPAFSPTVNSESKPTPRDECARLPSKTRRTRPAPLYKASPPPPQDGFELVPTEGGSDLPRAPEIVDLAAPSTWPRRIPARMPSRREAPSPISRCSTAQQSDMSFGILDYYTRDPSPLQSPQLPAPPPPQQLGPAARERTDSPVDPAMEQFDFGLDPLTPQAGRERARQRQRARTTTAVADAKAGAEGSGSLPAVASPSVPTTTPLRPAHKKTYSLFPAVKGSNGNGTSRAPVGTATPKTSPAGGVASTSTSTQCTPPPHHPAPHASYRPRKESLAGSVRSRKDSLLSTSTRRTPLRILSSSSTASAATKTTTTTDLSPGASDSPPDRSRWSDETITSPTAATTTTPTGPAPRRASFGSLLLAGVVGRDSGHYPDCFFEDDDDDVDIDHDEGVPLRRKFAWKRSLSASREGPLAGHAVRRRGEEGARFAERMAEGWWGRVRRVMLCGGCGAARRGL